MENSLKQIPGPYIQSFWFSCSEGDVREFASSQVMLMLPAWGTHFGNYLSVSYYLSNMQEYYEMLTR